MHTVSLDWLAGTFTRESESQNEFIRRFASTGTVVPVPAHNGYTASLADENGVQISWNPDREEMGLHAVFSGSALRNLQQRNGVSSEALLGALLQAGCRVTRLDLAKDVIDEFIDLDGIWADLHAGRHVGSARKVAQMVSNDGGQTIYIGSRSSEKFIRIYNKAAEQQLDGKRWTRLEIETKGMVARAFATALTASAEWAGQLVGAVRVMANLPRNESYQTLLRTTEVVQGLPKLEKSTDRERWIAEQVIAAVARHYIDNPNSEAVARLISTLNLIDRQRKD